MSYSPDPRADGLDILEYCALLPRQRRSADARALILMLPHTGIVVVPVSKMLSGRATVTVQGNDTYFRGGFELTICHAEIETAIEVGLGQESRYVYTREEAEALLDAESILTPGGIVFRKWVGYERKGETRWCRFLHEPMQTRHLDETMHFPARVLGTSRTKEDANV